MIKIFIKGQLNCWYRKNVIIEPESFTSVKNLNRKVEDENLSHSIVFSQFCCFVWIHFDFQRLVAEEIQQKREKDKSGFKAKSDKSDKSW